MAAETHSIELVDGRIEIREGSSGSDVLLLRRRGGYIYCGSSSPASTLNREISGQRQIFHGDEFRVGPFRLLYQSDTHFSLPAQARSVGFDWVRAVLCSLGVILLFVLLFRSALSGGPGDSGDGKGLADAGEGVGKGHGGGFGDGEGPGGGTGVSGTGSGGGEAGGGKGAGNSDEGTEVPEPESTAPSDGEGKSEPEAPSPTNPPAKPEEPSESAPAQPPPAEFKIAMISPGAVTRPSGPVSRGGISGEVGGGGQILGTGDVQVTLVWDTAPDVDLHVIDPDGEEIWFDHTGSRSGGLLDVDDTMFDGPENVFWPVGGAPRGKYRVDVVLFEGFRSNWKVRTRIDGVEKVYSGTLTQYGERQRVVEFTR